MDKTSWLELRRVNRAVNSLPYRTDPELYQREDFWTFIGDQGGDCEDYALEKRRRLLALGWPDEALRLAVCKVDGGGHMILTVEALQHNRLGTWVLDNMTDEVRPSGEIDCEWIMRQAPTGPAWVAIGRKG